YRGRDQAGATDVILDIKRLLLSPGNTSILPENIVGQSLSVGFRPLPQTTPMATLGRLMSLLSPFDVVIWMTDGWPLYESRLKGKLHVISKRYTQRIERHNLNLRQHLARLGRKSLSFSKSVELHDKVIGHYLNIKHYQ
ncbi:IS1 family transposase, partial [Enterobacter cloacae]|uniref:IS1 family transposase n=1 Tax=Enterobacter cloacae TaxID=550 RepID=UPI001F342CA7